LKLKLPGLAVSGGSMQKRVFVYASEI
jgi:hypothetical protein